jgi:hypothetical protein
MVKGTMDKIINDGIEIKEYFDKTHPHYDSFIITNHKRIAIN